GFLRDKKSWFAVKENEIQSLAEKEEPEPKIFNRTFDIVKHRKKIFIASTAALIIGAISIGVFQLNPGIDFTSGTRVEVLADEALTTEELEETMESYDIEAKSIVISGENNEIGVLRFDTV